MKKIFGIIATLIVTSLVTIGLASPALAAPYADPPVSTLGGYIFVSTSADGNITAGYSGSTGLSVYNSTTQQVANYTDADLGMTSVGEAVVSPDGLWIYILGDNPQVVTVFDVVNEVVDRTIPIPFSGWMGAITPDSSTLLVFAKSTNQIVKITLANDTVSSPFNIGLDYPYQLCVTSDSQTLYVPGYDAGYTSIVDIGSMTETDRLTDSGGPLTCALDANDTLFIGDYDTGAIRKYAADGTSTLSESGLVDEMYGMGLTCGSVIVGDWQNTGYVTLDRNTLNRTGTIASDVYTYMMSVNASATKTWVGGYTSLDGLQLVTETDCPSNDPLPDTGYTNSAIVPEIVFGAALLVAGGVLILLLRRRSAHK